LLPAARQLQAEVGRAAGPPPAIVKACASTRATNIVLLVCGEEQAAAFGVEAGPIDCPAPVAGQAYRLAIEPGRIILYATAPDGLFYAVQTLRQIVRLEGATVPALTVLDWPTLRYRGLMLDISRHKVPALPTLRKLIEELSHYKLNAFQLYTEDTFQFPRHPKIGAGAGSLSSEDILELDRWGKKHHVELMPNLQSFGHAHKILTIPEYRHLAETQMLWTLSPAFEGTYTLLDELYGDMLPAFSSPTLNVNCDETYDLGQGASKALVERAGGTGRVYLEHILRIRDLAARHGRTIQMWGDILLHHPELIGELPDDVVLLDWHYGSEDHYPTPQVFARAGRRFWVCPGVGSWNSIFPRLSSARVNIRNLVRDGAAAGAGGMLNTDWGDFGHYQTLGLSWHGYVYGAAQGWSGGVTGDEIFDQAFGRLFIGPEHGPFLEALDKLARTNDLPGVQWPRGSRTVAALFEDPLLGPAVAGERAPPHPSTFISDLGPVAALPAETLAEMEDLAREALAICEELAGGDPPRHPREQTLREMASAARLTGFAARKTALGQAIRAYLDRIGLGEEPIPQDGAAEAQTLHHQIRQLRALEAEVEDLRTEFQALWLSRARRSGIDVTLGYFAILQTRLRRSARWLEAQRRARLAGEPVDAELDSYQPDGQRILWETWPA
jgi:hypothetical protein